MKIENFSHEKVQQVYSLLMSYDSYLLAGHTRPDGDSLGSIIALSVYLSKKGKKVFVGFEADCNLSDFFYEILRRNNVVVLKGLDLLDEKVDVVVSLDASIKSRLPVQVQSQIDKHETEVFDIDHHLGKTYIAPENNTVVTENVSSTCELILHILLNSDYDLYFNFDDDISLPLAVGITTDTGFLTKNIKQDTVRMFELVCGLSKDDMRYLLDEIFNVSVREQEYVDIKSQEEPKYYHFDLEGKLFSIRYVVVNPQEKKEYCLSGRKDWRTRLMRAVCEHTDLVLVVNPDIGSDGDVVNAKISIRAYGNGRKLDLRPVASSLDPEGGGHPGAVGFVVPWQEGELTDEERVKPILEAVKKNVAFKV